MLERWNAPCETADTAAQLARGAATAMPTAASALCCLKSETESMMGYSFAG
jgi:hypothetical protein